ncbi:MAG: glycosyltransferase family 2 protein [Caldilinea sp. CFX5]|nr:glycosyltransferase family 2 protein [Caldilinea sp. CFX5]
MLVFNRPDLTRRVFERVREAQPNKLFIAADGPRQDRPGEYQLCKEVRAIVQEVDWECDVYTLFRAENLGLKEAVSSAITWFFDQIEEGIILEDDCLPDPTFFPFCAELLNRYRNDERIMVISGNNFQNGHLSSHISYYFSVYNHIWGWATWRRAWQHYDGDLTQWPQLCKTEWLIQWLGDRQGGQYWQQIFDKVYKRQINSWDYPWTYSCWVQHGLTILPNANLVSNIGFDERGTHTHGKENPAANLPVQSINFPLIHPKGMMRNYNADRYTTEQYFVMRLPPPRWQQLGYMMRKRLRIMFNALLLQRAA